MARFPPLIRFNRSYLERIQGSFWINSQLDSTRHFLTRLFPHRVIRPCRTYSPVENSESVNPIYEASSSALANLLISDSSTNNSIAINVPIPGTLFKRFSLWRYLSLLGSSNDPLSKLNQLSGQIIIQLNEEVKAYPQDLSLKGQFL